MSKDPVPNDVVGVVMRLVVLPLMYCMYVCMFIDCNVYITKSYLYKNYETKENIYKYNIVTYLQDTGKEKGMDIMG